MKMFATIFAALLITFTSLAAAPASNGSLPIYDTDGMAMHIKGNDHIKTMGTVSVELNSSFAADAILTVENSSGKALVHTPLDVAKGVNVLKFNVSEIPAGIYFVKVKTEGNTETLSFVVQ